MSDQETKYCSNCKRDIAMVNYTMHEVHCRRNIVLCEHCHEPVPRTELGEHFEEEHAKVDCELCKNPTEKSKLDEHKDVCPKRSVKCPYCELEQPYSELKEHEDFCGTRTELCPNCSQYIMMKHLNRHEESNCTYPEPKPQPSQNSRQEPDLVVLDDTFSSFAMEEFGRLTDMHNILNPRGPFGVNVNSNTRANVNRSTWTNSSNTASQNRSLRTNTLQTTTTPTTSTTSSHSLPRNRGLNQAVPHNRNTQHNDLPRNEGASEINLPRNRQTQRNTSSNNSTNRTKKVLNKGSGAANPRTASSIPDTGGGTSSLGNDLDRLLAMHLAHDLTPDDREDIPDERPNIEESLPCEFCGKPFPIDSLILHQTGCGPSDIHTPSPDSPSRPERFHTPPDTIHSNQDVNNSPSRRNASPRNNPPPNMVDNLAYLTAHEWFSTTSTNIPPEFTTEDDIMLPCEFCDQLLPEDFLVQHQAVCAANRTATPDLSNLASRSQPRSTTRSQHKQATAAVNSIASKSKRHQTGPSFTFLDDASNTITPSGGTSYHRNIQPAKSSQDKNKYSDQNIDNNIIDKTYKMMPSSQTAYRDSKSNRQIKPKSKSRPLSSEKQDEKNDLRLSSAARTRRTLDRLLEDPTYTTADLLAHMDSYAESVDSNAAMGSRKDTLGATGGSLKNKKNADTAEIDRLCGDLALDDDLLTRRPTQNDRLKSHKLKSEELGASGYQASFAGGASNSTTHSRPRKNRAVNQRDIGVALEDSVLRPAQPSADHKPKKPANKTRK